MSTLIVPEDRRDWPTLGPQIVAVMAETLVHGPGDLRGEPARLDNEFKAVVDSEVPFAEAGRAHRRLQSRESFGKVLLVP